MSATHPTFNSGHGFMTEVLNKQEAEFVGRLLHGRMAQIRKATPVVYEPSEYEAEKKRINEILRKLDYPKFEG